MNFAQTLNVERCEPLLFRSIQHRENFRQVLFGGQVLSQALMAAMLTVEGRPPHSFHSYFLRPGNAQEPVYYEVELTRDGRSISSRRVIARQGGKTLLNMGASFHHKEEGFSHQVEFPQNIPSPEALLADNTTTRLIPETDVGSNTVSPFHILPIPENIFVSTQEHKPEAYFWIKPMSALPDKSAFHYAALSFASDLGLLATSLLPHPTSLFEAEIFAASIDHAMWFHSAELNFNDWILCHTTSPWAGQARGFAQASIFSKNGTLLASTAQEGMVRKVK